MAAETNTVPPYVAYRTFRTFLESLAISMPDRIDRSVFDSKFSGTATSQITSALRTLKLIDADGRPSEALYSLARTEGEQHHKVLEQVLENYYTPYSVWIWNTLPKPNSEKLCGNSAVRNRC